MFELINEDLEQCIEILRRMGEDKKECLTVLAENRINVKDIEKTVELCQLLCYYYERVQEGKD